MSETRPKDEEADCRVIAEEVTNEPSTPIPVGDVVINTTPKRKRTLYEPASRRQLRFSGHLG